MPDHRHRAISAALAGLLFTAPADAGAVLDYVGTYVWQEEEPSFGGFSGLEISADGSGFHALSDRAYLYWGRIERNPRGIVRDMVVAGRAHLQDSKGVPLPPGYIGDSEGLAIGSNNDTWVSFEGFNRIARYDDPDKPAVTLPPPPHIAGMGQNAGLEALAIRKDGTVIAVPERSQDEDTPFTVLAFADGTWSELTHIRRDPRWLPVGADFGPDGWFYLLERNFHGILGFSSRVRRMHLSGAGVTDEEILLETNPLQYDNLESISVWDDGTGIRLTMMSDDNFLFVQRTEIVEYRLRDDSHHP